MGQDKASLQFRGERLVDRMAKVLARVLEDEPSQMLVSGRVEGLRSIPDLKPELGPIGGLWSISDYLRMLGPHLENHWLLIVPVDMPLLSSQTLRTLCAGVDQAYDAIVFEDKELPLLLRLTKEVHSELHKLVLDSEKRMRSIFRFCKMLATKEIEFQGTESEFLNVNTPADLEVLANEYSNFNQRIQGPSFS